MTWISSVEPVDVLLANLRPTTKRRVPSRLDLRNMTNLTLLIDPVDWGNQNRRRKFK